MTRYIVTVAQNRISTIEERDDGDEETLGIEWALSELKDAFRHSKTADATYSLADRAELEEFVGRLEQLLGPDAIRGGQAMAAKACPRARGTDLSAGRSAGIVRAVDQDEGHAAGGTGAVGPGVIGAAL